ncbi:MAG: hypothetical protein AB2A00_30320 [Myxococcota bacterium]
MKRLLLRAAGCALLLACDPGSSGEAPSGVAPPWVPTPVDASTWAGSTPHFRMVGRLNGEDLEQELSRRDAEDLGKLRCEREYKLPAEGGERHPPLLNEVVIKVELDVDWQERELQIELKKHDFARDTAGALVTIVPRDEEQDPARDQMWAELEWKRDGEDLVVQPVPQGVFTLGEYTGQPDAYGYIIPDNEGTVGGHLTLTPNEGETLQISFTARCGINNYKRPPPVETEE